jgi:hypothetical protein
MKDFVQNFFLYNNSPIRNDGDSLIVELDPVLQPVFNQERLKIVFDPRHVTEDTDLVTHGSFILNTIYGYLEDRGNKVVSRLREKFKPDRGDILKKIPIENGHISQVRIKKERTVDILFNFKISYLSDEKTEEIYQLGVDRHGVVFDALSYYTDTVVQNDLEPLSQLGGIDISRKDIDIQFRECLKVVSSRAQSHAKSLQNEILKRMHRNISRIKGYYMAQIEELHRNQPTYEEKRLTIEREYAHKLQEEILKHKLRAVIKLINFHVVERNEYDIFISVINKHTREEQELKIVFDSFTNEVDLGVCPSCQAVMETIVVTTNNTIACKHCSYHCTRCKKRFGDLQHAYQCEICGDQLCTDCVTVCSVCKKPVCEKHSDLCDIGNELVCSECLKSCSVCRKAICHEHTFYCSATNAPVCYEHRIICRNCRKIYSVQFIRNNKKGVSLCPACKEPLK